MGIETVEVKYDGQSRNTGNFFIELTTGNNRPSGHMKSEADLIIIGDGVNKYIFDRQLLQETIRQMIETEEVNTVEVWSESKVGRKWSVKGALVPREKLLGHAKGVRLEE